MLMPRCMADAFRDFRFWRDWFCKHLVMGKQTIIILCLGQLSHLKGLFAYT